MIYKIKISPESLSSIVKEVTYSGNTFGVYTGMTSLLTGGIDGTSTLTGLTIPILLTQDVVDAGYYSEFDGAILQKDTVLNFVFSGKSAYEYCIYNTSVRTAYTKDSEYKVYWGDQSISESMNTVSKCHTYQKTSGSYVIKLTQKNNFGTNIISKTITIPFDKNKKDDNPSGTATFTPSGGAWKNTPLSYDYIFTGDTGTDIDDYLYEGNVKVTGYTKSNLLELSLYGNKQYLVGVDIFKDGVAYGKVTNINNSFTAYTIQDIKYVDYPLGVTTFEVNSEGLTEYSMQLKPITKNEALMKSVSDVQIFSNVFVERGKNSGYEKVQRLGEVKTLQDMEKYGYGYFKLTNK
jgi:hypothetical protein